MDKKQREESLKFVDDYLNGPVIVKNYPKWARKGYFWLGVGCKAFLRRMRMKELNGEL